MYISHLHNEMDMISNNTSIIVIYSYQERQNDNVGKKNIWLLNFCCQMFQINEYLLWQSSETLNNLCPSYESVELLILTKF